MSPKRAPRLASRLTLAQGVVIAVGTITPIVAATFIAPGQFHLHLAEADVYDTHALLHAEDAFRSALEYAVAISVVTSAAAAVMVSWFLVRRISAPVEELADAANRVAAGDYAVDISPSSFSREMQELTQDFAGMAQRLARTDRVRSRMLADLAHEVRTPLATLQAYIDGLEDGVLTADAASWQTMRTQVLRLRRLADDIREVAYAAEHALAIDLHRVDGCETVRGAAHGAMPAYASKGVTLEVRACPDPCWVSADAVRVQQVLANLLDNALRYTPEGGTVSITARCEHDAFEVMVRDSGAGIPVDQLETVFERFHRVDPSRSSIDGSGSGLGLTIARAIAVAHGGSLHAASGGPGTGATFTLVLPRSSDHA